MSIGQDIILDQVKIRVPLPRLLCVKGLAICSKAIQSLCIRTAMCSPGEPKVSKDTGVGRVSQVRGGQAGRVFISLLGDAMFTALVQARRSFQE